MVDGRRRLTVVGRNVTSPVPAGRVNGVRVDVGSLLADGACALECDGDLSAGRQRFDAAYREAERIGDAEAMAGAAIGMGGLWVHEHRTVAGSALLDERLRRALSLVDPGSPVALRLRARLAGEASYRARDPAAILAVLDEARTAGDPVALAEALSIAHHCLLSPEHGTLRRALAHELVGQSFRTARRSDLLMGLLWETVDLFLEGDPHAGRRLAELRESLAGDDHLAVRFVVDAIDVMLAIRAGDLDRAESLAHACAERGRAAGDIDATGWHGAQVVAIRWYQGRLVELLPMLTELVDSPTLSAIDSSSLAALAVAAATAGDRPAATSALATLCGNDLAGLPRSSSWLATMNGIVEAAHLLDDVPTSARAYALLRPYAHLPMVGSLGIACFGSVHHALGVASLTAGELDRAVEHFHAAIHQNLALAHWPAVVTSRQRLAQSLTRRARPQDRTEARRELDTAAQEAAALGLAVPGVDRPVASGAVVTCTREGRHWRVVLGPRSAVVEHRVGMLHLAVLLANPGQEIDATDLAAGLSALGAGAEESHQPVLDRAALRSYQDRLARLRREIDDLEASGQAGRAARARAERDWLTSELAAAAGLGGRTRAFTGSRERARIAVGKAIRRAVAFIAEADPVIGEHLAHTVRTGSRCAYWPA
jgi:hypothetical protein